MNKKLIIQIVLIVVAIVLSYLVYDSIMKPVRFNEKVSKREEDIIEKLKDIRTMQIAYKSVNNRYTGSFDTLIDFLQNGKLPIVKKIGNVPDSLTEEQALKRKLVSRDTVYVNAYEELFKGKKEIDLANLKIIPHSENKEFSIKAAIITKSSIQVPVFEVTAKYDEYLIGLDQQLILNKKTKAIDLNRFDGLKLGSLDEPSTDGNWE
jgi:hypothetical protein